ncbi:unnamed protein product [Rhizopus stolonifer]
MNEIHSEQQGTSDNMVRKKRARATAEQLSVLEGVFAMNISPNGKVRKQLSQQLNMTERSVQIWFQNKRAKIKNLQKKAHTQGFYGSPYENRPVYPPHMPPNQFYRYPQENSTNRFPPNMLQRPILSNNFLNDSQCNRTIPGEHTNYLPSSLSPPPDESLRHNFSSQYLPHKQRSSSILETRHPHELDVPSLKNNMLSESNNHSFKRNINLNNPPFLQDTAPRPSHPTAVNASGPSGVAHYLPTTSITIGGWYRFKLHASDLLSVYEPEPKKFVWYIIESNVHFKIEIPLSSVSEIKVFEDLPPVRHANQTVLYEKQSDVRFHLCQIPLFYMRSTETNRDPWVQCTDFTENKQALKHFQHTLKGESEAIKYCLVQLAQTRDLGKLISFHPSPAYPSPNSKYSTSLSPALKTLPDFF